ncbi:hypothetical protein V9K67_17605 [Paraflavisolibacter sp. H34]|uniref:hypothetical protein n=1 Tax=Huijunlia imazamoxiresistens TaxID=3127457 RepID=UPI0030184606
MVGYFKLISKLSGNVVTFFALDIRGDQELDHLNALGKSSQVKQIGRAEYEGLMAELEEKLYFFDGRP